ncbi:hypothetical protein HPB48_005552 [Haemaphysalis longicornis]|uniref:Uncharacterized protein n=1 Tax=Haemaphysalis longicornis TaxID=44386 RepID=A0A9J6GVC4_HAELO|nr:hypothetical protein HPB48_005552 [Haemaphysalis longicornis]
MNKNFRHVKPSQVKEAKQAAIAKLDAAKLGQLRSKVSSTKNGSVCVFFAAKTHNETVPFRAIISEAGNWQAHLSAYLAKHLA